MGQEDKPTEVFKLFEARSCTLQLSLLQRQAEQIFKFLKLKRDRISSWKHLDVWHRYILCTYAKHQVIGIIA